MLIKKTKQITLEQMSKLILHFSNHKFKRFNLQITRYNEMFRLLNCIDIQNLHCNEFVITGNQSTLRNLNLNFKNNTNIDYMTTETFSEHFIQEINTIDLINSKITKIYFPHTKINSLFLHNSKCKDVYVDMEHYYIDYDSKIDKLICPNLNVRYINDDLGLHADTKTNLYQIPCRPTIMRINGKYNNIKHAISSIDRDSPLCSYLIEASI